MFLNGQLSYTNRIQDCSYDVWVDNPIKQKKQRRYILLQIRFTTSILLKPISKSM